MTIQEHLRALHVHGWGDSQIAAWLSMKINDRWDQGLCSHRYLSGPTARSVARWRKGKTKPTSSLHAKLVQDLYEEEQVNGKESN